MECSITLRERNGINVPIVKNIGFERTALGVITGVTGNEMERKAQILKLRHDIAVMNREILRINVKKKGSDGTKIVCLGLHIDMKAVYKPFRFEAELDE